MIACLKHWRLDLLGVAFTVLTDHHTLRHLKTQPDLSKRQARWIEFLSDYDFEFVYVPGPENTVADSMSRFSFSEIAVIATQELASEVSDQIKRGYTKDPFCVQMLRNLKSTPGVDLTEGVLLVENRIVVPADLQLREAILHDAHDALGHFGSKKLFCKDLVLASSIFQAAFR